MRKTGNSMLSGLQYGFGFLIPLLLFFCAAPAAAQQVEATVSENKIFIGEQFTLSIEVIGSSAGDVSLPVLPEIDGVRILSSVPSRSTSISIINGRTSASTSYNFTLIAREEGEYTIPPVSIEIDGEEYSTEPIPIEIIQQGNLADEGGRQRPDIFLRVEVDDPTPVPGQQIVASLVLYFKQGIEVTSYQPTAGWRTDGFWKEELENVSQPRAESVVLDGVRYRQATLIRYALFPNRNGRLTLSEFPLSVGIRSQPSRNDPFGSFFGGSGINQRRVSLESEPLTLNVGTLPEAGNAVSINAVGDLRVERRLNKSSAETGETIELITAVRGTGNIPLIRQPEYNLPDGLDLYTPQETSDIERRGETIRGEKIFTELLVSRAPGVYEIPAERVAVFNPRSRRYNYIQLPSLQFEAVPPSGDNQLASAQLRSVTPLQPLSGLAVWHSGPEAPFHHSVWFWVLLAVPVLALIAGLQQRNFRSRLSSDHSFARAHKAYRIASERISRARGKKSTGELQDVYNLLHKAVSGYITDKLGLPEAGLSDRELAEKVKEHTENSGLFTLTKSLLDKCATISYAPAGGEKDIRADIDKAEHLISQLRKQL